MTSLQALAEGAVEESSPAGHMKEVSRLQRFTAVVETLMILAFMTVMQEPCTFLEIPMIHNARNEGNYHDSLDKTGQSRRKKQLSTE